MSNLDKNFVQSVDKSITILEALSKEKTGLGVTELSNYTGFPKTTVFRLLFTLMSRGYVEKDIKNDKYLLGIKILQLGSAILNRLEIRTVARPYINELAKKTKEVVHLAILDEGEAVYIDKEESPEHSVRMFSQIGLRGPIHCTGVGKILLSGLSDVEVEKIIEKKGLKRYTKNSITDLQKLKDELLMIRKNGYCFDEMEHEEGIRCVAVPIFDRTDHVIAAISLSGPIFFVTQDRMPELTEEIIRTAKEISRQLGYERQN